MQVQSTQKLKKIAADAGLLLTISVRQTSGGIVFDVCLSRGGVDLFYKSCVTEEIDARLTARRQLRLNGVDA